MGDAWDEGGELQGVQTREHSMPARALRWRRCGHPQEEHVILYNPLHVQSPPYTLLPDVCPRGWQWVIGPGTWKVLLQRSIAALPISVPWASQSRGLISPVKTRRWWTQNKFHGSALWQPRLFQNGLGRGVSTPAQPRGWLVTLVVFGSLTLWAMGGSLSKIQLIPSKWSLRKPIRTLLA